MLWDVFIRGGTDVVPFIEKDTVVPLLGYLRTPLASTKDSASFWESSHTTVASRAHPISPHHSHTTYYFSPLFNIITSRSTRRFTNYRASTRNRGATPSHAHRAQSGRFTITNDHRPGSSARYFRNRPLSGLRNAGGMLWLRGGLLRHQMGSKSGPCAS